MTDPLFTDREEELVDDLSALLSDCYREVREVYRNLVNVERPLIIVSDVNEPDLDIDFQHSIVETISEIESIDLDGKDLVNKDKDRIGRAKNLAKGIPSF